MSPEATKLTSQDLSQARQAAEQFLQAVTKGDEAAARALLILGEGGKLDFKSMSESIAGYELGEPQAELQQVVVVAKVTAKPGKDQTPPLPMVLMRTEGAWKVDMETSINRMLGFNLGETMETLVKGLGDAMAKGMQAMGEGLAAGLSALSSSPSDKPPKKGPRPARRKGRKGQ